MNSAFIKSLGTGVRVLIPMSLGFVIGGSLLGQPAFVYVGLGLLIPGLILSAADFLSKRRGN